MMEIQTDKTYSQIRSEFVVNAGQPKHLVLISQKEIDLVVHQTVGSEFKLHVLSLKDLPARIRVTVHQEGMGCHTELYGLALTRGNQTVDVETHVLHHVGGGTSKQLFKNVLMDDSEVSFYGELVVAANAQKTEAQQTNRNLLLSPKAKMRTRPQLEIYADDVKCSHGATTGQLDPQALFYLQQRGIALRDAQRLLLQAFFEEVVSTLPNDDNVLDYIREQINSRLD